MTDIIWRDVPGTGGRYVVAVDGRIGRPVKDGRVEGGNYGETWGGVSGDVRLLDCARGADRWRRVRIRMDDGKLFQRRVAELVAMAWLLNEEGHPWIWFSGCRVVFREGAYDPMRGDHAGTLDVVDINGRSVVGVRGREIWEAWDRAVVECGEVTDEP